MSTKNTCGIGIKDCSFPGNVNTTRPGKALIPRKRCFFKTKRGKNIIMFVVARQEDSYSKFIVLLYTLMG